MAVDAQFVEHVQRHEAAVQERIARQDGLADIAALSRHALDEALGAPGAVYHLIEVPRIDLFVRAHRPAVLGARVQRADIVGDAEAEDGQYLLPGAEAAFVHFAQEGQVARRALEDDAQLLFVQLMGDDAVVRGRLLGQEGARLHLAENAVGFLARGGVHILAQRVQLFFDIGAEFFIGAAVLGRAMAAVGGVIVQFLLCAPEHFLVCLREGAKKRTQAFEVAFVPLVCLDLGLGEEAFAGAKLVEHAPVVEALDVVDQRHGLAQQVGKFRLGVVKTLLEGKLPVLLDLHGAKRGGAGLSARKKVDDGGDLLVLGDVARCRRQCRPLAGGVQRAVCQRAGKRLSVGERKGEAVLVAQVFPERLQAAGERHVFQRHIAKEEMTALFEDVVHGEIDEAHVEGPVLEHQRPAQVVDGGEFAVIVAVAIIPVREQRVAAQGPALAVGTLVFRPKPALLHALEKGRIDGRDLPGENVAQLRQPLFPTLQASPGDAKAAALFRLQRFGELVHAPERLAVFLGDHILFVRHRPADGFRADVKTYQICHLLSPSVLTKLRFCVIINV